MGNQTLKKILFYNHSGCENRGCEAIVRSSAELLKQTGAEIILSSDTPEFDRKLCLPEVRRVVGSTISPYSFERIVNSVAFRMGQARENEVARKYAPVIRYGRGANLCLSIGGDTYCYNEQEHMRVINRRLRKAGSPLVLWGCSVDPELMTGSTLEDLRAYHLIVARESITAETMDSHNMPVIRWVDPAFTMETENVSLPEQFAKAPVVGINVSPLVLGKSGNPERTKNAIVGLIRHILATGEDQVALIPHVMWEHDSDAVLLKEIKNVFADEERVMLIPDNLLATQYKKMVSYLRLLVTARTHLSIAGYSQNVPTLVIGYSVKARGIARDLFGEETNHLIRAQEIETENQLIYAYDMLNERAENERDFLKRRIPEYTQGFDRVLQSLQDVARA